MHLHFSLKDMIKHSRYLFVFLVCLAIFAVIFTLNWKQGTKLDYMESRNAELEKMLAQAKDFQRQLNIEKIISDRLPKSLSVGDHLLVVKGVYAASKTYDIPIDTILAIIEVESNFQKNVVSGAGAMGLMQLMEPTARDMAKLYGLSPDRTDPYNNIQLGTAFLRYLIDYYSKKKIPMTAIWIWVLHAYATGKDYEPGSSTQYNDRVEKAK